MHICISNLTIVGSDKSLSPGLRQAIIWTNDGILVIRPLGTKFHEILIEFLTFSFKKMRLKVSSAKWRPFCLGLNMLIFTCVSTNERAVRRVGTVDLCVVGVGSVHARLAVVSRITEARRANCMLHITVVTTITIMTLLHLGGKQKLRMITLNEELLLGKTRWW